MIQELIHQLLTTQVKISMINITLFKAIRVASSNGHLEVVKLLLNDPRVDPSVKDNEGKKFNLLL
jgi:ankyrin repeat protein